MDEKITTFTPHGNRYPGLYIADDKGELKKAAQLLIPSDVFWARLSKALNIVFVDHLGNEVKE